jgi:hypothetical protein
VELNHFEKIALALFAPFTHFSRYYAPRGAAQFGVYGL